MFEQKYIFLVDLYVKILPDLSAGLSYIALIRKLKKNCMFLMVDSKGDIDSCC